MRITSSATAISWIPNEAVEGAVRTLFDLGVDRYDTPPPEVLEDIDRLHAAGGFRTANHLSAWVDVEDGRIVDYGQEGQGQICASRLRLGHRSLTFQPVAFPDIHPHPHVSDDAVIFVQTTGGRTGLPAPRCVHERPYVQLAAPPCWSTISLTIHADGSARPELLGASPFPRHWLYDENGKLVAKTGLIDFRRWWEKAFGCHTPWGAEDSPVLLSLAESSLERQLSTQIMDRRPQIRSLPPGTALVSQGDVGTDVFVLLDGMVTIEIGGTPVAKVGPGAIIGEMACLNDRRRSATAMTNTRCRVAVVAPAAFDGPGLAGVAAQHTGRPPRLDSAVTGITETNTTVGSLEPRSARTFDQFFEAYLAMHSRPATRWLHFVGWHLAAGVGVAGLVSRRRVLLAATPFAFIAPPMLSHVLVERNAPFTGRPAWELRADLRLIRLMWCRRHDDLGGWH